jgi:hypothetical protein
VSDFYIVNAFDRPCERLIARKVTDQETGYELLEYLHPDLRNHGRMAFDETEAVPVEDFGVEVELVKNPKGDWLLIGTPNMKASKATYSDGRPRRWQGNYAFAIHLNPPAFRIWSFEHRAWWRPGRNGYTHEIAGAGIYPMDEALEIATSANQHAKDHQPQEALVPVKGRTF